MGEIEIIGEPARKSIMLEAMATKDPDEVDRIRKMGSSPPAWSVKVADFLTSHNVKNDVLVKSDGNPLTIGDVKSKINLWLAEKGC